MPSQTCLYAPAHTRGWIVASLLLTGLAAAGCSSHETLPASATDSAPTAVKPVANSETQVARERLRDAEARPTDNGAVAAMRHSVYMAQQEARQRDDVDDDTATPGEDDESGAPAVGDEDQKD